MQQHTSIFRSLKISMDKPVTAAGKTCRVSKINLDMTTEINITYSSEVAIVVV